MDLPQNISQLTLIKTFSNNEKYVVHTHLNGKSYMFHINVDLQTSVESFIQDTLNFLKGDCPVLGTSSDKYAFELYAARRSGRKISDLPSFESQQKIVKTGQKCFFLLIQQKEESFTTKTSTISTKSIRTEMKPLQIKTKESGTEKQRGCFCFS